MNILDIFISIFIGSILIDFVVRLGIKLIVDIKKSLKD